MINFVILTLSILVANLLTSVVALTLLFNKKVFKWYMVKAQKVSEEIIEELFENDEEETV